MSTFLCFYFSLYLWELDNDNDGSAFDMFEEWHLTRDNSLILPCDTIIYICLSRNICVFKYHIP